MKKIIVYAAISAFLIIPVEASTIVLKNGQTLTGNIVGQDDSKTFLRINGDTLTYYNDQISSLDGTPFFSEKPDDASFASKRELVEQILLKWPTENIVLSFIPDTLPENQRNNFLLFLKKNSYIKRFTEKRRNWLLAHFSLRDLKIMADLLSNQEGRDFLDHLQIYNRRALNRSMIPEIMKALKIYTQQKGS